MSPAERLFSAEAAFLRAEREIESLISALYDRWQDFEFKSDGAIDVYGVTPSPAAVDTLQRAGFRVVVEHDHASREFRHCGCRRGT